MFYQYIYKIIYDNVYNIKNFLKPKYSFNVINHKAEQII